MAYFYEMQGLDWVGLRDGVKFAAQACSVEFTRRSETAIKCAAIMKTLGFNPPEAYVPPWRRGDRSPILRDRKIDFSERLLAFYDSWDWKRLRYDTIRLRGRKCECCGSSEQINVDHIKPVRKYWELRLDAANLQILCNSCNKGKGSRDETDWREAAS